MSIHTIVIPQQVLVKPLKKIMVYRYDIAGQPSVTCGHVHNTIPPSDLPVHFVPGNRVNPFTRPSDIKVPVPPVQMTLEDITWVSHPEGVLVTIPVEWLSPPDEVYPVFLVFEDESSFTFQSRAPSASPPCCEVKPAPYPFQQKWCGQPFVCPPTQKPFVPNLCPHRKLDGIYMTLGAPHHLLQPVILGDSVSTKTNPLSTGSVQIGTDEFPFRTRVLALPWEPLPTSEPNGVVVTADDKYLCVATPTKFLRSSTKPSLFYGGFQVEVNSNVLQVSLAGRSTDKITIYNNYASPVSKFLKPGDDVISLPFSPTTNPLHFTITSAFLPSVVGWFISGSNTLIVGALHQAGRLIHPNKDNSLFFDTFGLTLERSLPENPLSSFKLLVQNDPHRTWISFPGFPTGNLPKGITNFTILSHDYLLAGAHPILMFLTILHTNIDPASTTAATMLLEVIE